MEDCGIAIKLKLPVYGSTYLNVEEVDVHVDGSNANMDDAAELVHSMLQTSRDNYKHRVQHENAARHSLKRRRTDDDLQRDRRAWPNENIDFCLAGTTSRTHYRMKRSDPLRRGLEAFAESKGKQIANLKLFYQGRHVSPNSTADDIGLETGESLNVYELVE